MSNYYEILGVEYDATREEIKKSFRTKIKELHPDIKPSTGDGNNEVTLLLKAYQILMDEQLRAQYDRHVQLRRKDEFNYRNFLKEQKDDLRYQAKLIFFDLLHNRSTDALELFEDLFCINPQMLESNMEREDFMDCGFLLAEEYEKRKKLDRAYVLYKRVLDFEFEKPYFFHFTDEIKDRIRNIICNKMSGKIEVTKNIAFIVEMTKTRIQDKEKSFYFKKMAELHLKQRNLDEARQALSCAQTFGGPQGGMKKLFKKMQTVSGSTAGMTVAAES